MGDLVLLDLIHLSISKSTISDKRKDSSSEGLTSDHCTRKLDPILPSQQQKEQRHIDIPKLGGPLAGTILPWQCQLGLLRLDQRPTSVVPWKMRGSDPGPFE
jgi:hypothetical protein